MPMWTAKLLYLFLTGIVFLFSMLYLPEFSVYLLLSMLLLPLGFFTAAHLTGRKLTAQLTVPSASVHPGKTCLCTILLHNPTWLPIGTVKLLLQGENTVLLDREKWEFHTSVPARGTAQLTISVIPKHCGDMQLKLTELRVYDFLHLFSHRKSAAQSNTFLVLPSVPLPPEGEIHTSNDQVTQIQPTTEPEEFLGVRSYRNGDRMRSIHWKLSSRFSEPIVREYGIPMKAPITLGFLYALHPQLLSPGNRLDAMLEALMAFSKIICSSDTLSLIICYENQYQRHTISTPEELTPILRSLMASPPGTDPSACQNTLEQIGDKILFCIADSMTAPPAGTTAFVADTASAGNDKLAIVPQRAAETVYHFLTEFPVI